MKRKSDTRANRRRRTPQQDDFAALDAWARRLNLSDGRPLTIAQRHEEKIARSVGRPRKADADKARKLMISMTPELIEAAGNYAKKKGRTLSGLIADCLRQRIKRKAS
jgi:hypothetical protein